MMNTVTVCGAMAMEGVKSQNCVSSHVNNNPQANINKVCPSMSIRCIFMPCSGVCYSPVSVGLVLVAGAINSHQNFSLTNRMYANSPCIVPSLIHHLSE